MKKENLGDLCDIVIGRTPSRNIAEYWGTGYPWVSISDLKEKYIEHTKEEITQAAIEKVRCRLIPRGTLLFSFKLSIGKMAFATRDLYTNEAIAGLIIKDSKRLLPNYLFFALKVARLLGSNQAAMGKTLNSKSLALIKVPVPVDLEDQIRIVTLLSRVEALIATRKDNLRLLDEFLKSTFLEMFGDPARNEKGWDKPELKNNFGEIITGNTPPRSNAANYSSAFIEWIKTDNIDQGHMYLTPASEFLSETGVKKARTVNSGALLVACIAGSIESIGRAALADRKVSFNQQINAIQPYSDMNPLFLYWLFRISKVYVQSFAPRGMKKILTKGNFEKITMIKPPKELQDQFALIVEKGEVLKTLYQQSLKELENLYGALSQKAFKGELDLSRIPLEMEPLNTLNTRKLESESSVVDTESGALPAMSDPTARELLLRQLFDAFIREQKGGTFSFEDFWTQAGLKVLDHMDDESQALGIADYDQARAWFFGMLKSGKADQCFNEENNRMELRIRG